MSDINHHHEEEYQDMTYISMRVGKAYDSGKTLTELAVQFKRPVKTIEELITQYNYLK